MSEAPSQKIRVLAVDDRPDTRMILSRLLEASGFEPFVAESGATALETYAAVRPSAVLLDIGMPGMDGFDVCRRIRQLPDSAAVLIVIVSGYEQDEYKMKGIAAGANFYFVKPVDPAKLMTLIASHAAAD